MANRQHPYDISIEDLSFLRHEIVSDFIADDGVICEKEGGILINFDIAVNRMRRARNLEHATELAMKQDGEITRYTRDAFRSAGLHIEPLDAA